MIDRSQVDPPEAYEEECTVTMCSGNCGQCELEEADYWRDMDKDEPIAAWEQERADWEAVNNFEQWRDRNE